MCLAQGLTDGGDVSLWPHLVVTYDAHQLMLLKM